jgi:hypothetical protein
MILGSALFAIICLWEILFHLGYAHAQVVLPRCALFTGYHHPPFLVFVGAAYASNDGLFLILFFLFSFGFGGARLGGFGLVLLLSFRYGCGNFFLLEVLSMLALGGSS